MINSYNHTNPYLPENKQTIDDLDNWQPIKCPECGSQDTGTNLYDELVCNSCGYDEESLQ